MALNDLLNDLEQRVARLEGAILTMIRAGVLISAAVVIVVLVIMFSY